MCDVCHAAPAAVIDRKGYTYCDAHRIAGRGRKLRAWEARWIAAGKTLPSYTPGPEPKEK